MPSQVLKSKMDFDGTAPEIEKTENPKTDVD